MKMKIKKWTTGQMKMERPPIKNKFKIENENCNLDFDLSNELLCKLNLVVQVKSCCAS
jgi:hypothetical protein